MSSLTALTRPSDNGLYTFMRTHPSTRLCEDISLMNFVIEAIDPSHYKHGTLDVMIYDLIEPHQKKFNIKTHLEVVNISFAFYRALQDWIRDSRIQECPRELAVVKSIPSPPTTSCRCCARICRFIASFSKNKQTTT